MAIPSTVCETTLPMNRSSVLIWSALLLLLLLPTPAGRVLINLVGGVALIILALPVLLAGLGWVGWKILESRLATCPACGATSLGVTERCTVCGSRQDAPGQSTSVANPSVSFGAEDLGTPASEATIDVLAQDAGSDS